MSRRGHLRGWIFLWALLQLAMPGAATYADALLERAETKAAPVAHIEADPSATCAPVHSADCALCQIVLRVATEGTPACVPSIDVAMPFPREMLAARPIASGRGWLPPPRAPPVV